MGNTLIPLALDIETSGLDSRRHAVLSVGLYISPTQYIHRFVKHDEVVASPAAFRVNKIDIKTLDELGDPIGIVEQALIDWVVDLNPKKLPIFPLGCNVGSFDMKFLETYMPSFYKMIGYRVMDINSMIFMAADKLNRDPIKLKKSWMKMTYDIVKKQFPELEVHHALFDAAQALEIYYMLQQGIQINITI